MPSDSRRTFCNAGQQCAFHLYQLERRYAYLHSLAEGTQKNSHDIWSSHAIEILSVEKHSAEVNVVPILF